MLRRLPFLVLVGVLGCSESGIVLSTLDEDADAGSRPGPDAFAPDAGPGDTGAPDAAAAPDAADASPDPDAGTADGGPIDAGPCEVRPTGPVAMIEEWSWLGDPEVLPGHRQVMMSPGVVDLDADGVPDVIFNTFEAHHYSVDGVLRAISGADGRRLWPSADPGYRTTPSAEVAIAEVDPGSPGPEIFTCSESVPSGSRPGHLLQVAADGRLLRRYDTAPHLVPCGQDAPAIGDMDGDGSAEIVVRYVIAQADGTVRVTIRDMSSDPGTRYSLLADVDEDPDLELVGGNGVYDHDGTALWERVVDSPGRPAIPSAHTAVADLDLDGDPEQVVVSANVHQIRVIDPRTGDDVAGPADVNPPELAAEIARDLQMGRGGGVPVIASFDDDPELEIGVSGGWAYSVLERDLTRRSWIRIDDLSSRQTGSSAFDFQGDGVAEALVRDERRLRVLEADGTISADVCNSSGTLNELAVPVDVDADGDAEIVVGQTDYSVTCPERGAGIRVFGGPRHAWVGTRRIWNQHSYHVTNVADDATVPRREVMPWRIPGLNAFRENIQLDGRFDAPDLVIEDLRADETVCPGIRIVARVVNRGTATAPRGVPVSLYEGVGAGRRLVATAVTATSLAPGAGEVVAFDVAPGAEVTRSFTVEANDPGEGSDEGVVAECRAANGVAGPIGSACAEER